MTKAVIALGEGVNYGPGAAVAVLVFKTATAENCRYAVDFAAQCRVDYLSKFLQGED